MSWPRRLAGWLDELSPIGGRGLRLVLGWLDDSLNPIVVKELRQAARGRFLAGVLILFLALQLLTLGLFLLNEGISSIDPVGGESYGQQVFAILAGILFFATILCVPVYAAVRIYAERAGDQMALFFVSTLAPHRIVSGKLLSNLLLSLLLFSACLPYLSFTYYLRGIDLPTIFVGLATGLLASASAILVAIFLASLPVSRVLRVLIGLAGLGNLLFAYTLTVAVAIAMADEGVGSQLATWEFWGPALAVLLAGALIFGLVFFLTVALTTHAAANRARPVRLYALGAWLVSAAAVGYACFEHAQNDAVNGWLVVTVPALAGSLLVAVCARDRMSLRVRGEVPASWAGRAASFPLFSGSANGVAFSALLIALTVAAGEVFDRRLGGLVNSRPIELLGFCAYVFAYALLAMLLQRRWLGRLVKRSQTWILALGLMAVFSLLPPIVGFLVSPGTVGRSLDNGLWTIANPFAPFQNQVSDLATSFGLGWAALMAVLAGRWFLGQVRAFRPPDGDSGTVAAPSPLAADLEGTGG